MDLDEFIKDLSIKEWIDELRPRYGKYVEELAEKHNLSAKKQMYLYLEIRETIGRITNEGVAYLDQYEPLSMFEDLGKEKYNQLLSDVQRECAMTEEEFFEKLKKDYF